MRRDRKPQTQVHAAGISLSRRIEKPRHLGEGHNLVELTRDLIAIHSQDRAVQVNVFTARQIRMKTCSHPQQTAGTAKQVGFTRRWSGDSRQNSKQRRLAGAVAADDSHNFSGPDFEADVFQSPDGWMTISVAARDE